MVYYRQQKGNTKYQGTAKENLKYKPVKQKTERPHEKIRKDKPMY